MKIFNYVSDSLKNYFGPVSKRLKKKSFRLMRGIKINLKIDRSNEPSSVTVQVRFPILSSSLVNRNFLYTMQFCNNNETQREIHDNGKYETRIM